MAGKKKSFALKVLRVAIFALILLLLYFPLLYILIQSVNASVTGTEFTGFTLKWYKAMFEDSELMPAIVNTITMAILATVISTVLGTLIAIGISTLDKKQRRRIIMLNNIPILNADIVTGVFLMLIFQMVAFALPHLQIFGYGTMLVAHIFFCIPYVILSVLPKVAGLDQNIYDAALDLGCRPGKALFKVIIPALKTGIITGALIAFTMSIDDFVISYMTSGNGVMNFSMWLYSIKTPIKNNAMQIASAYNTLISLVSLVALVVFNIVSRRKLQKGRGGRK